MGGPELDQQVAKILPFLKNLLFDRVHESMGDRPQGDLPEVV